MTTLCNEHLGALEDSIARNIEAREHVGYLKAFCRVLLDHRKINAQVYADAFDSLGLIERELLVRKAAVVAERNRNGDYGEKLTPSGERRQ